MKRPSSATKTKHGSGPAPLNACMLPDRPAKAKRSKVTAGDASSSPSSYAWDQDAVIWCAS